LAWRLGNLGELGCRGLGGSLWLDGGGGGALVLGFAPLPPPGELRLADGAHGGHLRALVAEGLEGGGDRALEVEGVLGGEQVGGWLVPARHPLVGEYLVCGESLARIHC